MTLYSSMTEITGNTPLLRFNRLPKDSQANIFGKLEFYNPASSVKDRIGVAIVDAAEKA